MQVTLTFPIKTNYIQLKKEIIIRYSLKMIDIFVLLLSTLKN